MTTFDTTLQRALGVLRETREEVGKPLWGGSSSRPSSGGSGTGPF